MWLFSFTTPRRTSDAIAVVKGVGDTDEIVDRVLSYYHYIYLSQTTVGWQEKIFIPNYRRKDFETEEELFEYVQDPAYNTNKT
jgi:hypothetical protein